MSLEVFMSTDAGNQFAQEDLLVKLGDTNLVLSNPSGDIRNRKAIDSDRCPGVMRAGSHSFGDSGIRQQVTDPSVQHQ